MNDEMYKELTRDHGRDIKELTTSVAAITEAIGSTNSKIEDLVEVIQLQNVLAERVENLDKNIDDYSKRMYGEITDIKKKQQDTGCPQLKIERENVNALGNSLDHERLRVDIHEKKIDNMITTATIKWFAAGLFAYMITFGVYVTKELSSLDKLVATTIERQLQVNKSYAETHERLLYSLERETTRVEKCQADVKSRLSSLEYKTGKQP